MLGRAVVDREGDAPNIRARIGGIARGTYSAEVLPAAGLGVENDVVRHPRHHAALRQQQFDLRKCGATGFPPYGAGGVAGT